MQSVREIIKESCARINLVPRRQAVPGDILENAYKLLKGVVNKYNFDNLLNWTQNSIIVPNSNLIHFYDETDFVKGDNNLYFDNADELSAHIITEEEYENATWAIVKEVPNVVYSIIRIAVPGDVQYQWQPHEQHEPYSQRYQEMKRYEAMQHVQVRDVVKINSIYAISNTNEPYKEHFKLDYINHTDFDKYSNTSRVYTYTQKSEGEWVIEIKPLFAQQHYRLKINYNEAIKFDLDSDLYIPDNYIELLIVALAHKLAIMYPRLDEAQMNRLQQEVQVLIDNVRTPKAQDRMILRNDYWDNYGKMSQNDLLSGRWI